MKKLTKKGFILMGLEYAIIGIVAGIILSGRATLGGDKDGKLRNDPNWYKAEILRP